MPFFSDSISSGKTAPSLFLHKQLDVTALLLGDIRVLAYAILGWLVTHCLSLLTRNRHC